MNKRKVRIAILAAVLSLVVSSIILIGGASALAGGLVCGITDYIWYYPRAICIFWFLMGILLAGSRMILRKDS
jgi:hypothetical protein